MIFRPLWECLLINNLCWCALPLLENHALSNNGQCALLLYQSWSVCCLFHSPYLSSTLHILLQNVLLTLLTKLLSWKSSHSKNSLLNNVPKWSLSTFIYPIRVILMTFHLQWTRLDLGQEIYGWDLISHSLKSPKWTLHQIFTFWKVISP